MTLHGLQAHPRSRCDAVRSIQAGAQRDADGLLRARYVIEGDLERLRIPPPDKPRPGEDLWRHTCCELFVASREGAAYREYNFSPSGQWAGYAFVRYREGGPAVVADPAIAVQRSSGRLELEARIPAQPGRLRLALAAVIEDREGKLSYWALGHPSAEPDFHHPEAFAMVLD